MDFTSSSERPARTESAFSKGPHRAPRTHSLWATKEEVRLSCQTNKDSRQHKSRGLGRSRVWRGLACGGVPGCDPPSLSIHRSPPGGADEPPLGRQRLSEPKLRSTLGAGGAPPASPPPAQPGPADNTHPRTPVPQRPGCAWLPPAPSPTGARSSDGPGRRQRRGGEPQPPAFGAAGGRTHSSPSPRVNSSRARSAPRLHPPAGAPRRPAPARPARRRRRPLPGR